METLRLVKDEIPAEVPERRRYSKTRYYHLERLVDGVWEKMPVDVIHAGRSCDVYKTYGLSKLTGNRRDDDCLNLTVKEALTEIEARLRRAGLGIGWILGHCVLPRGFEEPRPVCVDCRKSFDLPGSIVRVCVPCREKRRDAFLGMLKELDEDARANILRDVVEAAKRME